MGQALTARRGDQGVQCRPPVGEAQLDQAVNERTRELRALLDQRNMLLRELNHRVKNELQAVCGLLSLQAATVADPQTLGVLRDSVNRIRSIALVHERLSASPAASRLEMPIYVQGLCQQLMALYGAGGRVELKLDVEEMAFDIETATPCGMILSELISNALKYAFPATGHGSLWIRLYCQPVDRQMVLEVRDDGVGIPETLDVEAPRTLGLKLLHMLVEQLGGVLTVQRTSGTSVRITFPARTDVCACAGSA